MIKSRYKKLDYVMDQNGFISMIIYNSHPKNCIFISPKYFPHDGGPWTSSETGDAYERFEYYWNLKNKEEQGDSRKVYDVDKDPRHQYKENVLELFDLNPVYDQCHGVSMYCLPVDRVRRYYDAAGIYKKTVENPPQRLAKYSTLLKIFQDNFSTTEIGITGSYLYGLHQDFSDLNMVMYDSAPIERFHATLVEHEGLLEKQEVSLSLPGASWGGWLEEPAVLASLMKHDLGAKVTRHPFIYEDRFIGSIHDPSNRDTRIGFWISNTRDVLEYGTFKKKVKGMAIIKAKTRNWTSGMPSGNFALDDVVLVGFSPRIQLDDKEKITGDDIIEKSQIKSMQIIGEFNRMFLFNEEILALGLIQEISMDGENSMYHELLVGGRELGGWIIPLGIS